MQAAQIKAARALLGWSQADLMEQTGISKPTIARMEQSDGDVRGHKVTLAMLNRVFADAGIVFLQDDEGYGVRLNIGRPSV